ncbi:hypothetical protein LCGC14_1344460, partial [marine sediment metagenome]
LSVSEIVPFPQLIFSLKALTTEKIKGIMMVDKLENDFNISDYDKEIFRKEMQEREEREWEEMERQAEAMKGKPFKRDEHGNIISPFALKRKLY